ncbi:MAG: site-specific integrase [Planctomycetia bacterium]|nr:site-specific integrase [Planctomycetia bacterium]
MAWLQNRNGSWRVLFRYNGEQKTIWLGEVKEQEAHAMVGKVDHWLMRLKQQLVHLPAGCDIVEFVQHDGKPPKHASPTLKELTLGELRQAYFASQENKLEGTTLEGINLHFDHLERILGKDRLIPRLLRPDMQKYVDTRAAEWIDPNIYRKKRREKEALKAKRKYPRKNAKPPEPKDKPRRHPSSATIKKEIVSLRTAWNWARRHLGLNEEFPGSHLDYAKTKESLPFMTWEEAERRIKAGDDQEEVWECVYLRTNEVSELLDWVKGRPVSPWVYPMFVFAAHTGSRRSEIVRVLSSDVSLEQGVVTIREKKRDKRKLTTRRVPLSPFLKEVLADWLNTRTDGTTLFCKDTGKAITPREAHNYFQRALRVSKWCVLKGWHVFRHSFISALASQGVDQRIIDDMVGHQTEEQRRRYRHLYPDVKQDAIKRVFG